MQTHQPNAHPAYEAPADQPQVSGNNSGSTSLGLPPLPEGRAGVAVPRPEAVGAAPGADDLDIARVAAAVLAYRGPRIAPDEEQDKACLVVNQLYNLAQEATGAAAELISEAAAMLDCYQAGLVLATPHALTGYELRKAAPC